MQVHIWQIYERVYDAILLKLTPYQAMLEKSFHLLACKKGQAYLDAGCGTGNFLQLLLAKNCAGQLFGVDFSPAMLKRSRAKLGQKSTKVTLEKADLSEPLPFADQFFDGIACLNVFYTLSDARGLAAEFKRVLKPGGRLVLTTPLKEPRMMPIIGEHLTFLKEKHPRFWLLVFLGQLGRLFFPMLLFIPINLFIKKESKFTFYDTEELQALLISAGLTPETVMLVYGEQNCLIRAVYHP